MFNKVILFLLFTLLFCAGCATNDPTMTPTAVAVLAVDTAVSTSTPIPSHTPQPTVTPEPSQTPTATPTLPPTSTATPAFSMPSSPIIFVRGHALQQWNPQTNEFSILTEGVYSWVTYSNNIALFLREVTPEKEFDLIAFHIPTQNETVVTRLQSRQSFAPDNIVYSPPPQPSISISPDGKWLAYITDIGIENTPTIFVHQIQFDIQGISVSSSTFNYAPAKFWALDAINFSWPANNKLSWRDSSGIWLVDLNEPLKPPNIAIQPSTNTEIIPAPLCEGSENSCTQNTSYFPVVWSPDGYYLLVIESALTFAENWQVIEANSNQSYKFSGSYTGIGGDNFIWLDTTKILQLNSDRQAQVWHINSNENPFVSLGNTYQLPNSVGNDFRGITLMPDGHIRFSASKLSENAANAFYDFNPDNGELIKLSPDVPQREVTVSWSPNKQHVFSRSSFPESTNLLFDLNGSEPIDINSILGTDWCCLYWLEEE